MRPQLLKVRFGFMNGNCVVQFKITGEVLSSAFAKADSIKTILKTQINRARVGPLLLIYSGVTQPPLKYWRLMTVLRFASKNARLFNLYIDSSWFPVSKSITGSPK